MAVVVKEYWKIMDSSIFRGKRVNVSLESEDGRYRAKIFWDRRIMLIDMRDKDAGCVSFDHIANAKWVLDGLAVVGFKYFGAEWAE